MDTCCSNATVAILAQGFWLKLSYLTAISLFFYRELSFYLLAEARGKQHTFYPLQLIVGVVYLFTHCSCCIRATEHIHTSRGLNPLIPLPGNCSFRVVISRTRSRLGTEVTIQFV